MTRLRNNLLYVERDVKLYTQSLCRSPSKLRTSVLDLTSTKQIMQTCDMCKSSVALSIWSFHFSLSILNVTPLLANFQCHWQNQITNNFLHAQFVFGHDPAPHVSELLSTAPNVSAPPPGSTHFETFGAVLSQRWELRRIWRICSSSYSSVCHLIKYWNTVVTAESGLLLINLWQLVINCLGLSHS